MDTEATTPTETAASPESAHTTSRKGAPSFRVDLIPRGERRRRWTTEQKQTMPCRPEPAHPVAGYVYSEDRTAEHPVSHLKGFRGLLQVDGYAGFGRLVKAATDGGLQLAFCWAHTRRKFHDGHEATKSPLAGEALRRIGELYAIEGDIRGQTADERRTVRQER